MPTVFKETQGTRRIPSKKWRGTDFSPPTYRSDKKFERSPRRCQVHKTAKPASGVLVLTLAFDALFFHRLFGTDVLRDEEKNGLLQLMHRLAQGEARIVECRGRDLEKKGNSPD